VPARYAREIFVDSGDGPTANDCVESRSARLVRQLSTIRRRLLWQWPLTISTAIGVQRTLAQGQRGALVNAIATGPCQVTSIFRINYNMAKSHYICQSQTKNTYFTHSKNFPKITLHFVNANEFLKENLGSINIRS